MSEKLKGKAKKLMAILDDPDLETSGQVEFDIAKAHVVVTVFPLRATKTYQNQAISALNLISQNRENIKHGMLQKTNASEAIRANRAERDTEIAP